MKIYNLIYNDKNSRFGQVLDQTICMRYYKSTGKDLLILLHGMREVGPADGSQLDEVEKNFSWVKLAKGIRPGKTVETGSYEYPFDILAIQYVDPKNGLPGVLRKGLIDWIVSAFNPRKIGVLGISLGSIWGSWQLVRYSSNNHLSFAIQVCGSHGFPSTCTRNADGTPIEDDNIVDANRTEYAKTFPDLPIQVWHGDKDTTVTYASTKLFLEYYNKTHQNQIDINILSGVTHNAWDYAFKMEEGSNKMYKWVLEQFAKKTQQELAKDRVLEEIKMYL